MIIAVAHKWAADPQEAAVGPDGTVDWSRARATVSDYDAVAIEVGRRLADATGSELVGLSVGPEAGSSMARKTAMSRGLDRGLVMAGADTAGWTQEQQAVGLAALARRAGADVVLAGDTSLDESTSMTPALLAGVLGWSCYEMVAVVQAGADGLTIVQDAPTGRARIRLAGPAVLAVTSDAAKPPVPGMKAILTAGKKPVEEVPAVEAATTGAPLTITAASRPQRAERSLRLFDGPDAAADLAAALRADGVLGK